MTSPLAASMTERLTWNLHAAATLMIARDQTGDDT